MRSVLLMSACLIASVGLCQKSRLGGLPSSTMVVTGEVDAVAIESINRHTNDAAAHLVGGVAPVSRAMTPAVEGGIWLGYTLSSDPWEPGWWLSEVRSGDGKTNVVAFKQWTLDQIATARSEIDPAVESATQTAQAALSYVMTNIVTKLNGLTNYVDAQGDVWFSGTTTVHAVKIVSTMNPMYAVGDLYFLTGVENYGAITYEYGLSIRCMHFGTSSIWSMTADPFTSWDGAGVYQGYTTWPNAGGVTNSDESVIVLQQVPVGSVITGRVDRLLRRSEAQLNFGNVFSHVSNADIHLQDGDRAKIDGAVSAVSAAGLVYSNAVSQTVVWTNAAGAVTNMAVCERGVWSTNRFGGAEQALYSAVEAYNQLPATATTTVVVAVDKTVYRVDISTNVVLAFDTTSLNFTNKEVNFRMDLNILSTNGFNITFPQGWDYVPDLTVTGCYKFAVCATGPATMHVKQMYPTVYEWVQIPLCASENQTPAWSSLVYSKLNILTSTATNSLAICAPLHSPCIIKTDAYIGYDTHRGAFALGRGSFVNLPTGFIDQFRVFLGELDYKYFYEPASQNIQEFDYLLMYYIDTTANVNIPSLFRRQANELEISAYNAGWKP